MLDLAYVYINSSTLPSLVLFRSTRYQNPNHKPSYHQKALSAYPTTRTTTINLPFTIFTTASNTMYGTLISVLAAGKISLGLGGLLAPGLVQQAFLISAPSTASALTRMFATREIGLGAILWANRLRNTTPLAASSTSTATTTSITATPGLRQALLLGIGVDSLDAMSAVMGFAQGTLDWKQALLLGGGGVMVAGWGALCLRGVGRAGLTKIATKL